MSRTDKELALKLEKMSSLWQQHARLALPWVKLLLRRHRPGSPPADASPAGLGPGSNSQHRARFGEQPGCAFLAEGAQKSAGSPQALRDGNLGLSDQGICAKGRRWWGGRVGWDLEVVSGEEMGWWAAKGEGGAGCEAMVRWAGLPPWVSAEGARQRSEPGLRVGCESHVGLCPELRGWHAPQEGLPDAEPGSCFGFGKHWTVGLSGKGANRWQVWGPGLCGGGSARPAWCNTRGAGVMVTGADTRLRWAGKKYRAESQNHTIIKVGKDSKIIKSNRQPISTVPTKKRH